MGSPWGTYDGAAHASSFKDAVSSWRTGEPEDTEAERGAPLARSLPLGMGAPPGMGGTAASRRATTISFEPEPAPAPQKARAVAAVCYECMRRFTSEGMSLGGKNFCSAQCCNMYSTSAAGQNSLGRIHEEQAAMNGALNKQAESSVAAMGQAQAALPARALAMPRGRDKLGRSSLEQLKMRLSQGDGPGRGRGRGRARAGRGGARGGAPPQQPGADYAAGRAAVTASFVAQENAARAAAMNGAARADIMAMSSSGAGEESEMSGTGGGGSLWGAYDEAANAASFKDAVSSFRTNGGGDQPAPEPEQQPGEMPPLTSPLEKAVAKSSCYECFKLFPSDGGTTTAGRSYCSESCAPPFAAASPSPAPPAATPEKVRRPPSPGEKYCGRDGCPVSFVSWKGVAVITADGPMVFCSDKCCPE